MRTIFIWACVIGLSVALSELIGALLFPTTTTPLGLFGVGLIVGTLVVLMEEA